MAYYTLITQVCLSAVGYHGERPDLFLDGDGVVIAMVSDAMHDEQLLCLQRRTALQIVTEESLRGRGGEEREEGGGGGGGERGGEGDGVKERGGRGEGRGEREGRGEGERGGGGRRGDGERGEGRGRGDGERGEGDREGEWGKDEKEKRKSKIQTKM